MFYSNSYKNWETAQLLICHYDLSSQIVHLKKAKSKQTFFFVSVPYQALYMKTYAHFIVTSDINVPQKCCGTLGISV